MPEIVKVCGIASAASAQEAADAGATAIGMVFFSRSPRFVNLEAAQSIAARANGALRVGVFVNEAPEIIRSMAESIPLDVIQLHGDETPDDCRRLSGLRLWKALQAGDDFRPDQLAPYPVEAFLLDAPAGAAYGGTGRTFPWEKAVEAKRYGKVILAGGLHAANVGAAVRAADPWGVDASSKLERSPGRKDAERVRAYVRAAFGR